MEGKALDGARLAKGVAAVVGSPEARLGFYVVAEVSGEVAGVVHVTYEWSPWRNATFWWLANVFVRRGLASPRRLHGDARFCGSTGRG